MPIPIGTCLTSHVRLATVLCMHAATLPFPPSPCMALYGRSPGGLYVLTSLYGLGWAGLVWALARSTAMSAPSRTAAHHPHAMG